MTPSDPTRATDEPAAAPDPSTVTGAAPPAPDGDPTRTGGAADPPTLPPLDPPRDPQNLGRLDHYEILGVLGRGGMGVVLKARDEALDRVVAIKVLAPQHAASPAARKRFIREARAVAAVTHDNVVAVHAVVDRAPYLVMQYVPGRSLQQWLDERGPADVETVVRVGAEIAAGLAAAHATGLVHRDIKPSNVLLEPGSGRVKITDFGLARAVEDESVTQSGVIAGTPLYMSPEQARGDPIDARSDLFSLGSLLYALGAGHAPFRTSGLMAVLRRVIEDAPAPLAEVNPAVPDWLAAIVHRLLAKDPDDRFPSAAAVARLLADHLAHLRHPDRHARPAPLAGAPKAAGRPRVGTWVLIAGLVAAVTGLVGVGLYVAFSVRPPAAPGPAPDRPRFDDEFVYRTILADVEQLPPGDRENARYLSLHHVAAAVPGELALARAEFEGALKSVLKAGAPVVRVDPTATVFRIDLEKSGWHLRPFIRLDEHGRAAGAVAFNLYDLVLLEYPHAVIPDDSRAFDQVTEKFLAAARQVRPIAFVRGDWFVAAVTATGLKNDLRLAWKSRPPVPPGLDVRAVTKPVVWAVGQAAPGTRLPALDAWYAEADPPDPGVVKNVAAATFDARTKTPRDAFFPDDQFVFKAEVSRLLGWGKTTYVQYVYVTLDGQVEDRTVVTPFPAGGSLDSADLPPGGFAPEFGTESVRTYFSHHDFGSGALWRARIEDGDVERLVHDFFPIRKDGGRLVVDMSAAKITRKTVKFAIVDPKIKKKVGGPGPP